MTFSAPPQHIQPLMLNVGRSNTLRLSSIPIATRLQKWEAPHCMSDRIRFHLDENMDSDVAKAPRRQGIEVTTTAIKWV